MKKTKKNFHGFRILLATIDMHADYASSAFFYKEIAKLCLFTQIMLKTDASTNQRNIMRSRGLCIKITSKA